MKTLFLTLSCFSLVAWVKAGPGPGEAKSIRIEAETAFTVVNKARENSAIGVADGEEDSGQSVTLYGVGDAIQVRFSTPSAGTYRVGARVRAGGPDDPFGFWPDGYRFKLDGNSLTLAGEETSKSALDASYGGCFWGTMQAADVSLGAGEHTLEVAANAAWAVVDFFELSAAAAESRVGVVSAKEDKEKHIEAATAGAPAGTSSVLERVEAEMAFTVVKDTGQNGAIGVADGELDSGQSVRLYDQGDTVRLTVTAPHTGDYRLEVRVRSGGSTGPMSLWPEGYRVQADGKPLSIAGQPESVSALDPSYGGCFWGTMRSDVFLLTPGEHAIDIEAAADWGVLDYVQLVEASPLRSATLLLPNTPRVTSKQP